MSRLMRATALIGQPVVTLGGESPFEIKDVVFDRESGQILRFNLRRHGFFGGPVDEQLAWKDVHGFGPDAVVVADESCLSAQDQGSGSSDGGGDVMGNRILTEDGKDLGKVVEVVVAAGGPASVVGFEVEVPTEVRPDDDHHVFIPMPDTISISAQKIVVPTSTTDFIRDDLSGFGSAVEEFRDALTKGSDR